MLHGKDIRVLSDTPTSLVGKGADKTHNSFGFVGREIWLEIAGSETVKHIEIRIQVSEGY